MLRFILKLFLFFPSNFLQKVLTYVKKVTISSISIYAKKEDATFIVRHPLLSKSQNFVSYTTLALTGAAFVATVSACPNGLSLAKSIKMGAATKMDE